MYLKPSEHFADSHNVFPTVGRKLNTVTASLYGERLDKSTVNPHRRGTAESLAAFLLWKTNSLELLEPPPFPPASAGPAECSSLIRVSVLVTKDWCLSVNSQAALFLIPHYCFSSPLYLTDHYLPPSSSSPLLIVHPPDSIRCPFPGRHSFVAWCQQAPLTSYCLNLSSFSKVTSAPSHKAPGGRSSGESHKLSVWRSYMH